MLAKALELGLRLRPATQSDRGFIEQLSRSVFAAYGNYDRYLNDWIEDESVSVHVASLEDETVGFYVLTEYDHPDRPDEKDEKVADLLAIAVEPARQFHGIGASLLCSAIDQARVMASSPREMWLFVAEGNSRAQRLFARHGFRFRRGTGVYPAGQRALAMVKSLGDGRVKR